MAKAILAAVLAAISLGMTCGAASAQELPAGEYFEMHSGSFITLQQTPTGWLVVDSGDATKVNTNPPGPKEVVRFMFSPGGPQKGAILNVWNGYPKRLLYKGGIALEGATRFSPTSICPVRANLTSLEFWPEQLARVQLGELVLVEDRGPSVCK